MLPSVLADQVESSVSPVLPAMPISNSSDTDAAMRVQAVTAAPEPSSISLDETCTAQAEDDNLLPVIQALADQMRPAHADIRQYPDEARILLAQWDSLVLQDGILYRKFHYPDGTVNFLQIVYRRSCVAHSSSGCTLSSDTLAGQRHVMPCLAMPTFRVGELSLVYWYTIVQFVICTSGVGRHQPSDA